VGPVLGNEVGEFGGQTGVAGRVGQLVKIETRQFLGNVRMRDEVVQADSIGSMGSGEFLQQVVSLLVAEAWGKLHHDAFADEQDSFSMSVGGKLVDVEVQCVQQCQQLLSGPVDCRQDSGNRVALDLELSVVPLEVTGRSTVAAAPAAIRAAAVIFMVENGLRF